MLAMRRAVADLGITIDTALIDGNRKPVLACHMTTIIKGDARCLSIAAASVIAKVTRDRIMRRLAETYPGYGWETNVGYGTDEHYLALLRLGATSEHRRSFAPNLFLSGSDTRFRCRFAAAVSVRLERLQLLKLRADLHAVFDAADSHVGVLKWLRGGWFSKAIGYSASGEVVLGAGPTIRFPERMGALSRRDRLWEIPITRDLLPYWMDAARVNRDKLEIREVTYAKLEKEQTSPLDFVPANLAGQNKCSHACQSRRTESEWECRCRCHRVALYRKMTLAIHIGSK